jgi:hypothetical protein
VKKKWLLTLAVCVGLGLALVVGLGVDDAWQAARLEARTRDAEEWARQTSERSRLLHQNGAPLEELFQADQEEREARVRLQALREKQPWESWHARLLGEVRRRTGG